MRIKRILKQYRRDFYADYECPNCGHIERNQSGYDDANFHKNVIPSMECPKCGYSENDLNMNYRPLETKYPEGFQI